MEHEQLNYAETLRYLAKKYHIEIKEIELTEEEKLLKDKRESMFIVLAYANEFFQDALHNSDIGKTIVLPYITKERNLNLEITKKFQLGYNPESQNSFSTTAIHKGHKKDFLTQSGLSIDNGNELKDRFQGRLIFPVHSLTAVSYTHLTLPTIYSV